MRYSSLLLLFMIGCATAKLTIGNYSGKTEYEIAGVYNVYCWEQIRNETGTAYGCCCDPALPDRTILDRIHRCGH